MNHFSHSKLSEFSLIARYFTQQPVKRSDVVLGVGDDAALLKVPNQSLLAVSIDTLIEGVHFPKNTAPFDIGYKALAVNLSDLAAMGAEPAWFTLALTLPAADQTWLEAFSAGLFQLADTFDVQLIGGDTTRGSLSITIQIHGFVPENQAIRRQGARVGDKIYVSGTVGDAGLGLQIALREKNLSEKDNAFLLQRFNEPTPRVALGVALRDVASSAIDISDGLLADLNHILQASQVGAKIHVDDLPFSHVLQQQDRTLAEKLALTAGDDYELCFTVSPDKEELFKQKLAVLPVVCTCIGEITATRKLLVPGFEQDVSDWGFQHF